MSRASVPQASHNVDKPNNVAIAVSVYVIKIWVKPRAVPSSLINNGSTTTDARSNAVTTRNKRNRNAAFQVNPATAAIRAPNSSRATFGNTLNRDANLASRA